MKLSAIIKIPLKGMQIKKKRFIQSMSSIYSRFQKLHLPVKKMKCQALV